MVLIRLSSFYFFYFALLGVMAPYMGLFLESEGFSLLEISQLTSILMLTKVLAPNIWGALADRLQKRLWLVRCGSLLTLLTFLAFFTASGFWYYAVVIMLFSFFWNAVLPQYEVLTLHNLGAEKSRYSRIRLWGSIGFIVSVVCMGSIFDAFSIALFPAILLIIICCIFLSSLWRLSEPRCEEATDGQAFGAQLKHPVVITFFAVCFLLQLSHGAYYTYYSIYLETLGYTKTTIGLLWALGVIAEVVLFIGMHLWFRRATLDNIMFWALMLTALRWLMIAVGAEYQLVLIFAQVLHALSFGAMHAAAIYFVHHSFASSSQGRAQALYSSAGFGLGGAVGAVLSGLLVEYFGYSAAFMVSFFLAGAAASVIFIARKSFRARLAEHEALSES